MKPKKFFLLITFALIGLILSACSSAAYASTGWYGLGSSDNTMYLAAGPQVYAVDMNTGNEVWRYPAKANGKISFYANPVLSADGQLLVASYNRYLYSLNPANGSENWVFTKPTNRLVASPLVSEDMIFQPATDHFIYAIDLTGRQVWSYETGGPNWSQPVSEPDCGCVYVASMDHSVYAFNAKSGDLLWKSEDLGGAIVGSPAVDAGNLYVGTFGKEILAIDSSNGKVRWRFATQDRVWSGPLFSDGMLYFGDLSGNFYALNSSDGTAAWKIQPSNNPDESAIVSTPAILNDRIYLTTVGDTFYILDKAGNIVNPKIIGGKLYVTPIIANDMVFISPNAPDTMLIAMSPDGNQKWSFTPSK